MTEASEPLFLAIDQGGHSSRALVFDQQGALVASAVQSCRVDHPRPHWVEQDADELATSVSHALAEICRALQDRARYIIAAGLATQRSSIVCWDRNTGEALSPVISWQDTRAHDLLDKFAAHAPEIQRITGLRLTAHYGASKFKWCLENVPTVRAACEVGRLAWGPLASFLLHRLLAQRPFTADPANASRTLLWNLETRDWDPTLLALFALPREPLPECVPSRYPFGTLQLAGREVPLNLVTGDQSAALFAFGRPDPDVVYVNVGTGAFVQRLSAARPQSAQRFLASIVLDDGGDLTYALEGTVNGAASALRWLEREYGLHNVEAMLPAWLGRRRSPPLFLNGVSGLGSPYWVADFRSRFVGAGEDWEKAVAVLESTVFLVYANMEAMADVASAPSKVHITGGLTRLDGLCQRLADLSGLQVYRPAQCEATARGTAYLAARCPSPWPEPGPGQWFEPKMNNALAGRYQAWCGAMQAALQATA
ncbi:MAG: FGGY family carbohydrate kinase [Acidiferrobacterales bacterium]